MGGFGKGVKRVIAQYKRHGLHNLESIMYEGARHELLNELNKDEVYKVFSRDTFERRESRWKQLRDTI